MRVPPSAEAPRSAWSDTPDSACLAALDAMEQQAAMCRQGGAGAGAAAGGVGDITAGASPVPARQLSFTPTVAKIGAAARAAAATAAGGAPGATPLSGSSGSRGGVLPTSHLGRSALLQQHAAAAQPQQQEAMLPLPLQQQPMATPGWQQPAQHVPVAAAIGLPQPAGQKRSLAASLALEQVMAQHSPAAKQAQQLLQLQPQHPRLLLPAAAAEEEEPASKRLRAGEQADVVAVPTSGTDQQLADPEAPAPAPGGTAAPAGDVHRAFDYREPRRQPPDFRCLACGRADCSASGCMYS